MSVLDLSPDGTLTNKNNLLLNGILPSGLSFDKTGKNIAISFFQYLDFGKPSAGIDFYKFSSGPNPKVEKQASRINTSKGIHFLKVIEDF